MMIIQADTQGQAALRQLGELAAKCVGFETILKQIGLQGAPAIGSVLASIKPLPAAPSNPKPEKVESDKEKDKPDPKGDQNV